ncbi:MAG: ABC transporter ATP-binding protein, partial [Gammaproteobacteria bacterium]
MLIALFFAGLAEGIGLSALLPLLNSAIGSKDASQEPNQYEQAVNNFLLSQGIEPNISSLLLIIVIGVTIKSILLLIARRQVGYTAAQVTTDLRLKLLKAMLSSKWDHFVQQPVGKFTNSLASEATRSAEAFVSGTTLITYAIQAFIYTCIALAISWKTTVIGLAGGGVILYISHFLVRMAKQAGKKQTTLYVSLISRLTDTLTSVKPMKAMGKEHLADKVLTIETTNINKALKKQVFSEALLNTAQEEMFTIFIATGMFIALIKMNMPFATVLVLVAVLGKMLSQLGKVQKQYQKMVIAESAFWSMMKTINGAEADREPLTSGDKIDITQSIKLDNINFNYGEKSILRNLSLEIPALSLTTIIGPSGSGKTTVVDLIIGLIKPDSGTITIDNTPQNDLDTLMWRRNIGYVPQETLLLHDSIAKNVTLGDPELSDEETEEALKAAGAWDFVTELPKGMQSNVGER